MVVTIQSSLSGWHNINKEQLQRLGKEKTYGLFKR